MTTVADAVRVPARADFSPIRLALLGVGQVGGAVAALLKDPPLSQSFRVSAGLVRDTSRHRPHAQHVPLTANPHEALAGRPDIVIEALGGLEPARTLVLGAIERGIPVVTANKSLLAAHGEELLDAAERAGVPLRYEAAVLAGVPFLGTFARRPLARDINRLCGIVNGTTNVIASQIAGDGSPFAAALADAQRRGYAEPDPANDVNGVDAGEKLCVLLRHFGGWSVVPADLDVTGIAGLGPEDTAVATELGGALKPVVYADWRDGVLSSFAGPAFVPFSHPLARVNGVQNAVLLSNRLSGDLFFAGPGAGPTVTAATLLDDAEEIAQAGAATSRNPVRGADGRPAWKPAKPSAPASAWFVRVSGGQLPDETGSAHLLSAFGVGVRRQLARNSRGDERWLLTDTCTKPRLAAALEALGGTARCQTFCARVLE